ncbi:PREDICTED: uncharacterized protein LOC104737721 isoform X2 [Camelina sativa]|uniref:Uncharacterized protein LOC104737721 isoform X2 n=1 Tax=Camelina sativa TaxID=90675 RepID=A0ABM0VHM3_CAMSA|nr:PREDICTED: uncharacterized protein LOC104737721 isoform X2 [Camelina sativa]
MMKKATVKEGKTVTLVYWDIKEIPVPPGFDPRRVRPCINGLLESHGYSGPVTIYAVGILTDVHVDILRALSSSGIVLYYTPFCGSKIMSLMFEWMRTSSPPGNILGICNRGDFPSPPQSGYNLFTPFSDSSPHEDAISWRNLILTVSGTLEEDTCSETYESTSWFCSICHPDDDLPGEGEVHPDDDLCGLDLPGEGFETFTGHLSSQEHVLRRREGLPFEDFLPLPRFRDEDENPPTIVRWQPEKATPEESEAVTSVFWDINLFPVPPGFDARLVRWCINRLLESHGYSAPPTIYAVGLLTNVHDGILQALSSTGITLYYAPHDIRLLMSQWISKNPPPTNILGICDPRGFPPPLSGYNIFRPFSYSSPKQDSVLWGSSLLTDSGALEEDTCSETDECASWCCLICNHIGGQGFENFTRHLSTPNHLQNLSHEGSSSNKRRT